MGKLIEGNNLANLALLQAHDYSNLAQYGLVNVPGGGRTMIAQKIFCHTSGFQDLEQMSALLLEQWEKLYDSDIICAMLGLGRQYNPASGELTKH